MRGFQKLSRATLTFSEAGVERRLTIFADYHQVYVQDDDISYGDLSDAMTEEAMDRGLVVSPHALAVLTARNMDVPVTLRFSETRPGLAAGAFDKLNECALQIDTGRLVVMGCTDYFPDAERVPCAPGRYGVIVGHKDLDKLSEDGLEGEDSYHLYLWPEPAGDS